MKPAALPPVTEADVIDQCLAFLAIYGVALHRRNVGGRRNESGRYVPFGEPGQADYFGTYDGRTIEIEFKRTGWRPRGIREKDHFAQQVSWLNGVNAAGGVGIVVDRLEWLQVLWPAIQAGRNFKVHDDGTMEVL